MVERGRVMRVLFLSPIGAIGGAERVLLTAVAGLRDAEPNMIVRVIAPNDGPLLAAVRELGAEAEVVAMPAALSTVGDSQLRTAGKWRGRLKLLAEAAKALPETVHFVARMRSAIRRFKPSLVHSNGIKTHLLSRLAVPPQVPVVWHLHDFYGLRPMAARVLRRMRGRVAATVAISNAVACDTASSLGRVPVVVIPNTVDLARFMPGPGIDLDAHAGLPPSPPGTVRVGLIATYARWKGQLVLLDAARHLAIDSPDLPVRWYIIGGPIYHTSAQFTSGELRAEAAERGVADRVGFVPFLSNPAGAFCALDVVVHASTLPEPFGLTIVEAMACGRAVVVSAAGGAMELFTDGHDGLGVVPGDAPALGEAVRRLVAYPEQRASLGDNARRTAATRFDSARYGPQLLALYHRLILAR